MKLHLGAYVKFTGTNIAYHNNIEIGGSLFVNNFCSILAGRNSKIVFIGDCLIGPSTIITTVNHSIKTQDKLYDKIWDEKDVIIGEEVWIGGNCTILPGVSIARGCIIGAGSVVTKTIQEEYSIVGGVPAKVIKKRP